MFLEDHVTKYVPNTSGRGGGGELRVVKGKDLTGEDRGVVRILQL